ncbi:hypothetical protein LUZ63_007459 [Rhynchospora breviuscula]|uniref:Myb/SANT-like domain-containing protein n=1 Tax=Rhynchospora breviuscula TaxID=2022672 RepID=A0A9Q0CMY3_9POAL|nr:hypothetical protein LUZ63_005353 [Rhynchospora breviuscula]KAJ1698947.1 hypothetical protein LUZ63_007459 [Rhynchospora breviuscula]
MKPSSSQRSRNKKGAPSASTISTTGRARINPTRVPNWLEDETNVLLDVLGEVKLQRGMNHINFKDYTEIYELFKSRLPNSTYTKENCKTRVKHLKGQFSAVKHFTSLSGGYSWNYNTNMLNIPNEDLQEIIERNTQKYGFLKRSFPWFRKLETMCEGSRAEGDDETMYGDRTDAERIGDAEGSGSSDTPDVGGPVRGRIEVDVDDDPYPNAPSHFEFEPELQHDVQFNRDVGQQGSDSTMNASRSSGSNKRKSSDGAGPSVSRGKKIKDTLNVRTRLFQSVADNDAHSFALNEKLVSIFEGQLSVAEKKLNKQDKEMDRCIERLDKMIEIDGELRLNIIEKMTEGKARNVWLRGRDADVYLWIARNFPQQFRRLRNQQQGSQPFPNEQTNPPFGNNDDYLMNFVNQYNGFRPPPQS